ncbi:hypothetical protein GGQ87_001792 [Brevundimonas alba]|uniref:WW domain-containing protein n=1 Tax=Brevundimonas alba TaxID=74314 RepID=A0A7X5YKX1_9CAUL|nr:ThuA domain-containing protein [Brevundimonas alba]NJC41534.1 hypothetical protein [Brevundimonas alba]
MFLALGLAACSSMPTAEGAPVRVLYLSQSVGFVHDTARRPTDGLAPSEIAMQEMARDSGAFAVELTQDARELTAARLNDIDVLVFGTTGSLPIDRQTWSAIVDWIESGRGGFVGIHSAADTALDFEGGQEAYTAFIGGRFDGHPWTQGTPIRLTNLERSHPLASMWPDGTDFAEEIYQYTAFEPDRVRVLQTLDMSAGPIRRPYPVPITWVREMGGGRLFYTNLGHTPSTWADPRFRRQIVDAIRWSAHRLDAPAAANPAAQDWAALTAFAIVEGVPARAGSAGDIRDLQALHPEKHNGDTTAWDLARLRIRAASAK